MRRLLTTAAVLLAAALAYPGGPAEGPAVENFHEVGPILCVGGEPIGDDAFRSLAAAGVTTIVSVDGAKPDLAAARRHGLRYVHVPFGYGGVPREAGLALARIACEADGRVFVHCHHGKHRGPAAAAIVGRAAGLLDRESALSLLDRAGTSRDYAGLWWDVAAFTPPAADVPLPELVESAEVASLAAAMADLDRTFDRLRAIEAAGWTTPPEQPDVAPHREATLLREAFRESARLLPVERSDLRTGLTASERLSAELTESLQAGDGRAASAKLAALKTSCTECHRRHRDGG